MSGPGTFGAPADRRPRLDRLMERMVRYDSAPWGWQPVLLPLLALVVLIVLGTLATHLVHPAGFAAALTLTVLLDLAIYGLLVVVVRYAGRDLTRRYAGWGWTFGLQRPRRRDAAWAAAGVGMVLVGRVLVVAVADILTHGAAGAQSQNLVVHNHSPAVYVVLTVVVVLVAPPVEETVFRGMLLRTLMRRYGFWPAALLSSAVFALFHTYEVATLAGAATLAGVVFVLGLTNCLLARWTGRLAAGIAVHMLFNALAVAVVIATG